MKFEKNEFLLCLDCTNNFNIDIKADYKSKISEMIIDAVESESLHLKWFVDKEKFLINLKGGTEDEFKKLWSNIQHYWSRHDRKDNSDEL